MNSVLMLYDQDPGFLEAEVVKSTGRGATTIFCLILRKTKYLEKSAAVGGRGGGSVAGIASLDLQR